MPSTTEQVMALESAVWALLDAGDTSEYIEEVVEEAIRSWKEDN